MLASSIPTKVSLPFGSSAPVGNITVVPVPSQIGITADAASYTDGFPPLTFLPGGAPRGQDFNGLLNNITAWNQWQAGGGPVYYDSVWSAAVGGYPAGALISSTAVADAWWLSTADNNTSDPDTGGANWILCTMSQPYLDTRYLWRATWVGTVGGTANALTGTYAGGPSALFPGLLVYGLSAAPNTGATTFAFNSLGVIAVERTDSYAFTGGEIAAAGQLLAFQYDGTVWRMVSPLPLSFFSVAVIPPPVYVTAAGANTVTTPAGMTSADVELWGGSGGGGGTGATGVGSASGGGGGEYRRQRVTGLTPGGTTTVTIGAGGTAGATGSTGGNGGVTTWASLFGAGAGQGGTADGVGTGGAGGSGSHGGFGGDFSTPGTQGQAGFLSGNSLGGSGGGSPFGASGGGGGDGIGAPGSQPGGGGGGAGSTTIITGGAGAPGMARIQFHP